MTQPTQPLVFHGINNAEGEPRYSTGPHLYNPDVVLAQMAAAAESFQTTPRQLTIPQYILWLNLHEITLPDNLLPHP